MAQLLVVSPDDTVLQVIAQQVAALGHGALTARTLQEAQRALLRTRVDVICLDSVVPVQELRPFWRWARADPDRSRVPLLLLASKAARLIKGSLPSFFRRERDGLVSKPIDRRELSQELTRLLARRRRARQDDSRLQVGPISLDLETGFLFCPGGASIRLTPIESRLMRYLAERAGEFVSSQELLERVWGYHPGTGGAEVVRAHMRNLRMKIGELGLDAGFIRTLPRRGYGVLVGAAASD